MRELPNLFGPHARLQARCRACRPSCASGCRAAPPPAIRLPAGRRRGRRPKTQATQAPRPATAPAGCATGRPTATRPARRPRRPRARTACRAPAGRSTPTPAGPVRRRDEPCPSADPRRRGHRRLDVARGLPSDPARSASRSQPPITSASAAVAVGVGRRRSRLQLGAAGVQPAAVQHRGYRQRRRRRILDGARIAAAVGAMPPPAGGDPVDDVRGPAVRSRASASAVGQTRRRVRGVRRCTSGTTRPPRRRSPRSQHPGAGRGDHVGDVCQRIGTRSSERSTRINTSHLAALDGDEDEGFLGHEAEHGGQCRDESAGPVQVKVAWMRCRHGANFAVGTVRMATKRQLRHRG